MILPELTSLPKSASVGPETWGEAFGRVVDTSDQVMVAIENATADGDNRRAAYQSYIDEVEQATGEKLQNPMDVDLQLGTFEQKPNPTYSFDTGSEWREERARVAMERFEAQRQALAAKYPAQARLITLDIDGRVTKRMRQAEQASLEALQSPELGMAGRFAAQIVGGLKGSARDPVQWSMAVIGGGAGTARTVAGRIGQVMLTEALINGGSEAVLQAASQERKRRAGLEHGLNDALKNVGIAATFGSLFGGVAQGGAELARIFKLGEGGDALAARVLDGRPEPGDVETLAKAMNVEISPERLDLLTRSFEERVLDEVTIPQDGNPATMRVYEAALRHAEDPDNFPAPELVERMVAEEEAGRLLTLTPEQYERFYGGDRNTIDDIADTFFADDLGAAGRRIDAMAMRVDEMGAKVDAMLPEAPGIVEFQTAKGSTYTVNGQATVRNKAARDLPGHEGDFGQKDPSALTIYLDDNAGALSAAGLNGLGPKGARVAIRDGKATLVTWNEKAGGWGASEGSRNIPYHLEPAVGRYPLELWNGAEDVPGYQAFSKMHAGNQIIAVTKRTPNTLEAQRIRPDHVAEPLDDAAMRAAEVEAGDLIEPQIDANGNPKSLLDYIAVEDGNGNYRLMPARQALDEADEPAMLADLLESCKL